VGRKLWVVILISVVSWLSCKSQQQDQAVALNGVVSFVVGKVSVERSSGDKLGLAVGDLVSEGDKVVTAGEKSLVDIQVAGKAIRVLGDSWLYFSRFAKDQNNDKEDIDLVVEKGSVFSKIVKKLSKGDKYKVRTQTATASVRGTEFLVENLGVSTQVACLNGKVAVVDNKTEESQLNLSANEEAKVEPGKDIVKSQVTKDRLQQLQVISNIKLLKEDVIKRYIQQKEEIRQKFVDDKKKIEKAVSDQKEKNQEMLKDQKLKDRQNIEKSKEQVEQAKDQIADKVNESKKDTKKMLEEQKKSIKPKTGIDQFKK
jgi:hypothetical protein